jgi:predicted  nucleic acid-binding Zn-ribbon protein
MNAVLQENSMNGGPFELESRVATLESDVRHIRSDIADIKIDVRRLDDKIDRLSARMDEKFDKLCAKMDERFEKMIELSDALRQEMQSEFKSVRESIAAARLWAILFYIGMGVGLLTVMAHGFGWLK